MTLRPLCSGHCHFDKRTALVPIGSYALVSNAVLPLLLIVMLAHDNLLYSSTTALSSPRPHIFAYAEAASSVAVAQQGTSRRDSIIPPREHACRVCSCDQNDGSVNCAGRGLRAVPLLPPNTTSAVFSDNSIIEVRSGDLAMLPNLTSLDFSAAGIASWAAAGVLTGTSGLQTIDLSGNNLSELPEGALGHQQPHLVRLVLRGNQLDTLPADLAMPAAVKSGPLTLPSLQYLDLAQNTLAGVPINAIAGLPSLYGLDLSDNELVELPRGFLNGAAKSFQLLDLSGNSLRTLPFDAIAGAAANLTYLGLSRNALSGKALFDDASLARLKVLNQLELDGNPLRAIHRGTLSGLDRLMRLDLSRAQLQEAPLDLTDLRALTELRLARNDAIRALPEPLSAMIELLDLSGNNFGEPPTGALRSLNRLQALDLSDNPLGKLGAGALGGPNGSSSSSRQALYNLGLRNCSLTDIDQGLLTGFTGLGEIYLADNNLASLPVDLFSSSLQLHVLNLDNLNQGRHVVLPLNIFAGLSTLQQLRMQRLNLTMLAPEWFTSLRQLSVLILDYNSLDLAGISEEDALAPLANSLNSLSLAGNHLKALPWRVLAPLQALQSLVLADNKIKIPAKTDFRSGRSVARPHLLAPAGATPPAAVAALEGNLPAGLLLLDLSNNTDIASVPGLNSSSLIKLSLAGCAISVVNSRSIAGLVGLESLDLSDNPLNRLAPGCFAVNEQHNNSLTTLSLARGNLTALPYSLFCDSCGTTSSVAGTLAKLATSMAGNHSSTTPSYPISIDLSGNRLDVVDQSAFTGKPLAGLNLKDNPLSISPCLGQQPSLQVLRIGGAQCHLGGLSCPLCQTCSSLQVLDVANAGISSVGPHVLQGMTALVSLDLSNNPSLVQLPQGTIAPACRVLITIVLAGSGLEQVPSDLGAAAGLCPLVAYVDLSRTRIRSIPKGSLPSRLLALAATNADIGQGGLAGLSSAPHLRQLMLWGNRISLFESAIFANNSELTDLHLFNNAVTKLPAAGFLGSYPHLRHLTLFDNVNLSHLTADTFAGMSSPWLRATVGASDLYNIPTVFTGGIAAAQLYFFDANNPPTLRLYASLAPGLARAGVSCDAAASSGAILSCKFCPAGTFGDLVHQGCLPCPHGGFYQPKAGAMGSNASFGCLPCPAGTYSPKPGANDLTACRPCPPGTNSSTHADAKQACRCLSGFKRSDPWGECVPNTSAK
eukprot:UC1_evm1s409